MSLLTITSAEVCRAAGLDATVTANTTDAGQVITDEQDAIEYLIDPAAFALVGVTALLRRNVAKLLAAELWEQRSRADGGGGDIVADGVQIHKVPNQAASLRTEARAALAPYLRKVSQLGHAGPTPSTTTPDASPVSKDSQDALFGPSEVSRATGNYASDDRF